MDSIEWREIKGFENYSVSNTAQIRNNNTGRILKQTQNKSTGYMQVAVSPNGRNGKHKLFRIHREVALAWMPNPDNKSQVNHKDCNKTNNSIENLEWVSNKENVQHAHDNNLVPIRRGEDSNFAVLTDDLVRCVREEYAKGGITLRELGIKYGVAHNTLSNIICRVTWKHIN